MFLFFTTRFSFIITLFLLSLSLTLSVVDGKSLEQHGLSMKDMGSSDYKRLASYCFIDDYTSWLQRQQEFFIWFDLAKILKLPIDDDKQLQHELQQYRLQQQCLRVMERLPVAIGPG